MAPKSDHLPIRLEQVTFTRTVVITLPDHDPTVPREGAKHLPINEIKVEGIEDSPRHYIATMRTRINPDGDPADPYTIDMECVGFFVADDTITDDEARAGITVTGHSVLYGAIRECVAWMTGRHGYGGLMLGLSMLRRQAPEKPEK